jgi:hypothetical protein
MLGGLAREKRFQGAFLMFSACWPQIAAAILEGIERKWGRLASRLFGFLR